jgi:hypothetical protein
MNCYYLVRENDDGRPCIHARGFAVTPFPTGFGRRGPDPEGPPTSPSGAGDRGKTLQSTFFASLLNTRSTSRAIGWRTRHQYQPFVIHNRAPRGAPAEHKNPADVTAGGARAKPLKLRPPRLPLLKSQEREATRPEGREAGAPRKRAKQRQASGRRGGRHCVDGAGGACTSPIEAVPALGESAGTCEPRARTDKKGKVCRDEGGWRAGGNAPGPGSQDCRRGNDRQDTVTDREAKGVEDSAPTGDPEVRFLEVAGRPILHDSTSFPGLLATIASPSSVHGDAIDPGSGRLAAVTGNAVVKSSRSPARRFSRTGRSPRHRGPLRSPACTASLRSRCGGRADEEAAGHRDVGDVRRPNTSTLLSQPQPDKTRPR